MKKILNKKIIILILCLAVMTVVSGCIKKIEKTIIEDNNNQKVEEPENQKQKPEDTSTTTKQEKFPIWPDVSFTEEDYKGWETYVNAEIGYSIKYPADWIVDECKECLSKEIVINPTPEKDEPYITYIGMGIDFKYNFNFIIEKKYEYFPDTFEKRIIFSGKECHQFSRPINSNRLEMKIILNDGVFDITTDRRYNKSVLQTLASLEFID